MIMHAIQAPAVFFWRIDLKPLASMTLSFNGRWRLRSTGCLAPDP